MALDSDLLRRLREALKDPDTRSLIRDEVNQSGNTDLDTTWGKLGAVGKAMQRGTGSQVAPWATGLGAGIGLLLRPLKQRRHGTSGTANRSLDDTPPAPSYTPPPPVNASSAGTGDAIPVEVPRPWEHGYTGGATASVADQQKLSTGVPEASAPPVPASQPNASPPSLTTGSLVMGHGQFGNNVFSNDGGKTWTDENTGAPYAGQIFDKDTIGPGFRRGGKVAKSFVKAEPAPPPSAPPRGVLVRRPMAIPILHTTIVIARKPEKEKPVKKQDGGKVAARPPLRGPGNGNKVFSSPAYRHNPPAPFAKGGRVQVPRGSGAAQRGKHFRGIF